MTMKKLMIRATTVFGAAVLAGCGSTGLTEEAQNDVPTSIWYENANILVQANDPDLKADSFIGVPALDAIVDTVKDIMVQAPVWAVSKAEEKQFENAYMESAKALNGGADGAELVVKGEAFKCALMMDTFAQEVAHADAATSLAKEAKKANYAQNGQVYDAAVAKVVDYANNQVYVFQSCADDAARKSFFAAPERGQWGDRSEEIAAKIKKCVAKADNEAAAKAAVAKLCKEMGVKEFEWSDVAKRLVGDLAKMQQAVVDFANALQSNSDLQTKIAAAAFGGEIVPGTSGKETLAVINRVRKQLQTTVELLTWLSKSVVI